MELPETEEDRIDQFLKIRSIPIHLKEKKLLRKALLDTLDWSEIKDRKKRSGRPVGLPYQIYAICILPSDVWFFFQKRFLSFISWFLLWIRTQGLNKIEGQYGKGVLSYFVLLRWLILLNILMFLLSFFLIIIPSFFLPFPDLNVKPASDEISLNLKTFPCSHESKRTVIKSVSIESLIGNKELANFIQYSRKHFPQEAFKKFSKYCEIEYKKEIANHTTGVFQDFLQGTGWLQSTILFLGFYPDSDVSYVLPAAFIAVLIASFLLSLVIILHYSYTAWQEDTLKGYHHPFSSLVFCSWDHGIKDEETAAIKQKSIISEIKNNLAKKPKKPRKLEFSHFLKILMKGPDKKMMKVVTLHLIINTLVMAALFNCLYLIHIIVNIQLKAQRMNDLNDSDLYYFIIHFISPLVITTLNIIMPIILCKVVEFEDYEKQTAASVTFFRIAFLRLTSLFVMVNSIHMQITCKPKDICQKGLDDSCQSPRCWETYIGQQLYRLVITDFLVYVCVFLGNYIFSGRWKSFDLFGRQVFDLPNQVLSLAYSQQLSWLGLFYSPLLPGITLLKFLIVYYMKKVVVLKRCVLPPVRYKASCSNFMLMIVLLIPLFLACMNHGYSLTSIEPSLGCSPFRKQDTVIDVLSELSPFIMKYCAPFFSGCLILSVFITSLATYHFCTVIRDNRKLFVHLKNEGPIDGRDKHFARKYILENTRMIRNRSVSSLQDELPRV